MSEELLRRAMEVCHEVVMGGTHAKHNAANLKNRIDVYLQAKPDEPAQSQACEPVAWVSPAELQSCIAARSEGNKFNALAWSEPVGSAGIPLYTHPPAPSPASAASSQRALVEADGCHGLDTPERVRFYEHDFYPLSNFSAFTLRLDGISFDTSEAAYHWMKFPNGGAHTAIRAAIRDAISAHEAFKIAERKQG